MSNLVIILLITIFLFFSYFFSQSHPLMFVLLRILLLCFFEFDFNGVTLVS